MNIFDIIIPLVAGFGGTLLGIRHTELSRKKEYKSVLLLLIQEFILLLERSTMHYYQFVKGHVHSSALFQISDNNTFLKLAQVCDNTECIKVALELKADFFQNIPSQRQLNDQLRLCLNRICYIIH